jgi:Lon protease-like protein
MSDATPDPTLPIFPLPSVVLFPAVGVPLYIFEPRYRQMTADALAGAGRVGMVAVDPRVVEDMAGSPRVFEVGCAGEIRSSDARPDGTYHILLHGLFRFRIRREILPSGERLYRTAEVEALSDLEPEAALTTERSEVLELMRQLLPDRAQSFRSENFTEVEDTQFVNAFCQAVELSTSEKQKLLEANGVRDRIALLVDLLQFRRAEHAARSEGSRGTVH